MTIKCPFSAMSSQSVHATLVLLAAVVPLTSVFAAETPSLEEAERLYQSEQYKQAAVLYDQLLKNADDAATKQQRLIRMGDCVQVGWLEGWGSADTYYQKVLEQGYSPYLFQAFRKWRASYHGNHYGMTNAGGDPSYFAPANEFYSSVKERVLQVIEGHLKEHPDDTLALAQREGLQQLADIVPGGPFGSSVLDESADLWPEFSE